MSQTSARWCFNLSKWSPSYQELLLATACIQPEEKTRLAKFVFTKDFKSSLIGRLMMRKFVADNCGLDYASVRFGRDDRGRPFLIQPSEGVKISFNVSHQGDYAVFAGELGDFQLGVDVMKLEYTGGKSLQEFFRIMNRNFSTLEWRQIYNSLNPKEQLNIFCRLWSLKESYTKAIGLGITVKLSDISFKLGTPLSVNSYVQDTELYVKGQHFTNWCFSETLLDDNHCVAVATDKIAPVVKFAELDFTSLTLNAQPLLPQDENYCLDYFKKPQKP